MTSDHALSNKHQMNSYIDQYHKFKETVFVYVYHTSYATM